MEGNRHAGSEFTSDRMVEESPRIYAKQTSFQYPQQ